MHVRWEVTTAALVCQQRLTLPMNTLHNTSVLFSASCSAMHSCSAGPPQAVPAHYATSRDGLKRTALPHRKWGLAKRGH